MEKTKFDIKVEWVNDDDTDLSYLGEYKAERPNTAYADRKHNILIVPFRIEKKEFVSQDFAEDFENELEELEIPFYGELEESEDGENPYIIEYPYYEKLPFSCHFERNDYQFITSVNYEKPEPEDYKYIVQDVKLLESYGNSWNMRGCIVTASLKGIELAHESLWGLNSTMSESDDQEVIDDLTAMAEEAAQERLDELKSA